jgi:hypothetical protein
VERHDFGQPRLAPESLLGRVVMGQFVALETLAFLPRGVQLQRQGQESAILVQVVSAMAHRRLLKRVCDCPFRVRWLNG